MPKTRASDAVARILEGYVRAETSNIGGIVSRISAAEAI